MTEYSARTRGSALVSKCFHSHIVHNILYFLDKLNAFIPLKLTAKDGFEVGTLSAPNESSASRERKRNGFLYLL